MKKMDRRELRITMRRTEQAQALLRFLQRSGVTIRQLTITDRQLTFLLAKHHLPIFRQGRKKYRVKTSMRFVKPDKILQKDFVTLLGVLLLVCVPLILRQFIWDIQVESAVEEVEDELTSYLQQDLQLQVPLRKEHLLSDTELRQQIMQRFREFSWVHIAKEGSRVLVMPEFAPKAEREEQQQLPLYLVANSSGVITHFNVESGERKVKPNMTVYKGDLLVSGILNEGEQQVVVGAKGEVYADYWLETTFTVPRTLQYDRIVEQVWHWQWNEGVFGRALEGRTFSPFKEMMVLEKKQKVERVAEQLEQSDIEARLIPLLHKKILGSLPQKSSIKSENLLHVTFDDDTVKGKVLFFVNENIAMPYDGQGD